MKENLTMQVGGCDHRAYVPGPVEPVMAGAIDHQTRAPIRVNAAYRPQVKVELGLAP